MVGSSSTKRSYNLFSFVFHDIKSSSPQNNVQTTSLPKTLGKYFCFIKSRKISLNVVVGSIVYVRVWLSTSSAIQTLFRQIDISTLYPPLSNSDIIFTHTTPPTPFAYFLPRCGFGFFSKSDFCVIFFSHFFSSSDSFFKFRLSRLQINAKAACSGSILGN